MQRNLISWRPAGAVLIALAASVVITACGGSSPSGAGAASVTQAGLQFAACVRAHGVPEYPDPATIGGGTQTNGTQTSATGDAVVKMTTAGQLSVGGHTLPASAQVVQKALGGCQEKYAAAAPGPVVSSAQLAKTKAGVLAKDRCLRAHGAPNFPDQTVSTGPGGHGIEISAPFGAGSRAITESLSPALKAAEKACNY